MTDETSRVSIGLPTYNRPELLALVLENFRQQTFSDFELIISDNASPDPGVRTLCERVAASDRRFRYVRQPVNRGPEANFWYVYDQARAPLFLWASDDDIWPVNFLEKGVAALDANRDVSAWFCQVVNINSKGDIVRTYPSFSRFQSTPVKFWDLARYLWEPEIMGKANLIYSIFRRETLQDAIGKFRSRSYSWGSDMNLVYGYLCQFNLIVDDRLVLQKRVLTESVDAVLDPRLLLPKGAWNIYSRNFRMAAAGSKYVGFTSCVLAVRFLYDRLHHQRSQKHIANWFRRQYERGVRMLLRIKKRIGVV